MVFFVCLLASERESKDSDSYNQHIDNSETLVNAILRNYRFIRMPRCNMLKTKRGRTVNQNGSAPFVTLFGDSPYPTSPLSDMRCRKAAMSARFTTSKGRNWAVPSGMDQPFETTVEASQRTSR